MRTVDKITSALKRSLPAKMAGLSLRAATKPPQGPPLISDLEEF